MGHWWAEMPGSQAPHSCAPPALHRRAAPGEHGLTPTPIPTFFMPQFTKEPRPGRVGRSTTTPSRNSDSSSWRTWCGLSKGFSSPVGGGGQESRRCKSTWGCSREPWPKVQLCHRPAVPGPVFPTAEQFLRVWGWSVGNGGQTPLQALPANCRSWCLGKNAFLRYLVKDMGLRKCPGRPPPA